MTLPGAGVQNHGAVFTRRWVVEVLLDLTGYTTDRDLGRMHLLEPSCGSGAFLGPAVERLIASAQHHGRDLAALGDAIRPYDLQAEHVRICRALCCDLLIAAGVSDGFQVTMTGLRQAAGMFRAEAGTFAAIMPAIGPASVDGGSAEINDALNLVLEAAGGLQRQLAAVIGQHGDKLEAAYGTYRDAEDAIVKMSEAIATARQTG